MPANFEVDLEPAQQLIVFLAGIGQDASSWDPIIAGLRRNQVGVAYSVTDLVPADKDFTMAAAVSALNEKINRTQADKVVLVGLSVGAAVALSYVIAYPSRVAELVLSGGQVRPSPAIMLVEMAMVRVLPERTMGLPAGLTKARLREILNVVSRIDFRKSLPGIEQRTLVICGSKDRPNLSAARALAEAIPNASLEMIEGGGHELNTERPVEFGHLLAGFTGRR